ncbi:cell division protein FtsQ/DivIB [Hutsoniella sourekii]|uniref:cell division protein FtsQ/DivIB n=1 Tax=Hutsoniella sourekii TaxID=87650 RepID=UPI000481D592|nr:cell division protein FtsQ/DivIB [Hutsoniella sourekii]
MTGNYFIQNENDKRNSRNSVQSNRLEFSQSSNPSGLDRNRPTKAKSKGNNNQASWYQNVHHRRVSQKGPKQAKANQPAVKVNTELVACFILLLIILVLSAWQLLPFNKVNQLQVENNYFISQEQIINSSRILPLDKLDKIYAQRESIQKKMKSELPALESIVFKRENLALVIQVKEYDIVAVAQDQGQYLPLLSNGSILPLEPEQELSSGILDQVPVLVGFEGQGKLAPLANDLLRNLNGEILGQMDTIYLIPSSEKPNAVEIHMKDGNIVKGIISTLAQKMIYYPQMLEQIQGKRGVINLEVGAYFTPDLQTAETIELSHPLNQ